MRRVAQLVEHVIAYSAHKEYLQQSLQPSKLVVVGSSPTLPLLYY